MIKLAHIIKEEDSKEESAEDAAISECEFYLNTQHTFGEFYTDISCN